MIRQAASCVRCVVNAPVRKQADMTPAILSMMGGFVFWRSLLFVGYFALCYIYNSLMESSCQSFQSPTSFPPVPFTMLRRHAK
jgi:hypothetical protein